ncbi:MAG: hypothetical protein H7840_01245 [Alphaproteobacteria bacterium]
MTYVSHLNALLKDVVGRSSRLVAYGQNVVTGSCLSGLTRGLIAGPDSLVFNTPNAENALVGLGFGVMLRGHSAIYFMKQQDFLLLGFDHLVNTWNVARGRENLGSFSVVTIVVDSGYEGPQSCLNNFSDFCSMAHLPGYAITNAHDAGEVIGRHLVAPGCRIIGVSQRLFSTEIIAPEGAVAMDPAGDVIRYAEGPDATIVAFNFSFPEAWSLHRLMGERGRRASLFSVPAVLPVRWDALLADVRRSGRLLVLDDGKSENRTSDRFLLEVLRLGVPVRIAEARRHFSPNDLAPNPDRLTADWESLIDAVFALDGLD